MYEPGCTHVAAGLAQGPPDIQAAYERALEEMADPVAFRRRLLAANPALASQIQASFVSQEALELMPPGEAELLLGLN